MYFSRYLDKTIGSPDSKNKVKLLLGPRQSGKTTLLMHFFSQKRKKVIINLQDRRIRIKYERNPEAFLQELELLDPETAVLVDEIQKIPSLLEDVQYISDRDPHRFEFFLTGSSARKLKTGSANLLPGRAHLYHMSPVLQTEHREAELLSLPPPKEDRFPLRPLEDHLIYGSLPGLYEEEKPSWVKTLSTYVELYVENEIRKENVVQDIGAFLRFLHLAALESGQIINYSNLANGIGVSVNTIKNYYQILEDTYIGFRLPAFGRSRKKILRSPRFLIFDTGVRNSLAELPLNNSLLSMDPGHLFEQFVLIELYYRCLTLGREFRLSTWRTSTGAEVDGVVETPDEVIPIEIKWTTSPRRTDIRHLQTFLNLHSKLSRRGFLISRVDQPRKLSERVIALPWNRF